MTKKECNILSIGQCDYDNSMISKMLTEVGNNQTMFADSLDDAKTLLAANQVDLILVNRILDKNRQSGIELIGQLKKNEDSSGIPVMLVSNFEDAQAQAVEAGAVTGFGKSSMDASSTHELIKSVLNQAVSNTSKHKT